mgnify:CR=1 FL=1
MKKSLWILLLISILFLAACTDSEPEVTLPTDTPSPCALTPLAEGCYTPSDDLDFISTTPEEYLISETFDDERINSTPRNWLLYRDQEYAVNGVIARIQGDDDHRFVEMFSDGKKSPQFPQNAPNPTFIFTTKFNLDIDRKGVLYGDLMIPSDKPNYVVNFGLATGSVNTISVRIEQDMRLSVKVGGPFFYYSGTGDGGDVTVTTYTLTKDTWYRFKLTWDASDNLVAAYIIIDDVETLLHSAPFHISNRFNAEPNGMILVPNVARVTMPRDGIPGWAYLDNVILERKGA